MHNKFFITLRHYLLINEILLNNIESNKILYYPIKGVIEIH